jgi:hypothetical protein
MWDDLWCAKTPRARCWTLYRVRTLFVWSEEWFEGGVPNRELWAPAENHATHREAHESREARVEHCAKVKRLRRAGERVLVMQATENGPRGHELAFGQPVTMGLRFGWDSRRRFGGRNAVPCAALRGCSARPIRARPSAGELRSAE